MSKRALAAAVVLSGVPASGAMAAGLDINLHDEAAEFVVDVPAQEYTAIETGQLGGGLLFNDDGDVIANAHLHVSGPPTQGFSPLVFGTGVKGYSGYLDEPDRLMGGVALTGSARLSVPAQVPQAAILKVHFGPDITTSSNVERILETTLRYEFQFTPQAGAYLGYRYFDMATSDNYDDQTIDDSLHLGVRIGF